MRHDEDLIQQLVVRFMRSKYPSIPFTCSPATAKNPHKGIKNKKMGYCKGWPDLFFAAPYKGFNGLFIELKTPKGKISKEQSEILTRLADLGYKAAICRSADEAIETIERFLN